MAGIIQFLTGSHPYQLIFVLEFFYAIIVLATYTIVRRQASMSWALLAATAAAATPGVLQWARDFAFALPAAACVTLALSVQLWAGDFQSRKRSITWGLAVGLSTLTRTMTLGIVPGLVLAGAVRLAASGALRSHIHRPGRLDRRVTNFVLGLAAGVLVAATWYVRALPRVLHYLVGYGYGSQAAQYGPTHSLFSWSWWMAPFDLLVNTELYLPLTLACVVAVLVAGFVPLRRWKNRGDGTALHDATSTDPDTATGDPSSRRPPLLARECATVAIVLAAAYVSLASTRNQGSGFELLLVPEVVILSILAASRAPRLARPVVAAAIVIAAGLSFVDQAGLLPGGSNDLTMVSAGPVNAVVFDAQGNLFTYASAVFGGCPTIVTCVSSRRPETAESIVRSWARPSAELAHLLHDFAATRGREPVVLFAVQDPFVNVNSVGLDAVTRYGQVWPIGVVSPPVAVHASYAEQLQAPQFGEPNFVVTGTPSRIPASAAFSPLGSDRGIVAAAWSEGFRRVGAVRLPDSRVMSVWWHPDRGPVLSPS
ncbi:MAG: hypothetical protein ACYCWW_15890 [Deltaproteobacteria bacterium]